MANYFDLRGFAKKIIGAFTVTGLLTVGSLLILGSLSSNQNVTAPSFTATSTSGGGYRFGTNGNVDIGTSATSAGAIYASGTAYLTGGVLTATSTVTGTSTASTFAASRAGTATNPPFTFSGDTDTGVFNESANQLSLTTGGSRGFLLDTTALYSYRTIIPGGTTNILDAGSPTVSFRSIYASTTIFGVNETLTGTSTAGGYLMADDGGYVRAIDQTITSASLASQDSGYTFAVNGIDFLGVYARSDGAGGLQTSSTALIAYQNLLPFGNNTIDVGTSTRSIGNFYASGTAVLGSTAPQILGTANVTGTHYYVGTGDGCLAVNFYASNTAPVYSTTSTANCVK